MKIRLEEEQVELVVEVLKKVDSKSYNPMFSELIERVVPDSQFILSLEEGEVYALLEACTEFVDYGDTEDEEKESCNELKDLIEQETGLLA